MTDIKQLLITLSVSFLLACVVVGANIFAVKSKNQAYVDKVCQNSAMFLGLGEAEKAYYGMLKDTLGQQPEACVEVSKEGKNWGMTCGGSFNAEYKCSTTDTLQAKIHLKEPEFFTSALLRFFAYFYIILRIIWFIVDKVKAARKPKADSAKS